jgi:two-component system, NtrC family, sensor kinase
MLYKKYFLLFGCLYLTIFSVIAQEQRIADSLSIIYKQSKLTDTAQLELLKNLSFNEIRDLRKGLGYAENLISLAQQSSNNDYLRIGYFLKGTKHRLLGNLEEALSSYFKSAEIAGKIKSKIAEGESYGAIADVYSSSNNHSTAKLYYNKAITALRQTDNSISLASTLSNAGDEFLNTKNYDSALIYFNEAKHIFENENYSSGIGYIQGNIGMVYASIGNIQLAEKNINEAIGILTEAEDYYPISVYLLYMSDIYNDKGNHQQALNYALKSLRFAEQYGLKEQIAEANLKLSELYEKTGNINLAHKHYKNHIAYRDSINNINTVQNMANLRTNYEVSKKQVEVDLLNQQKQNEKNISISLAIILGLSLIILIILIKNNKNKQIAYNKLNFQKQQTEKEKAKAEEALVDLQITQKQLIQSAKMASLGELTAGIAHEIQNPLNFVNNFSEVSVELLGELKENDAFDKLHTKDKVEVNNIISNLEDNLNSIAKHGKRADSIVKGMLLHSRTHANKKEPTDINALADEYLRLSYHGLRAKDKTFNANFILNADDTIGKIDVVPQEIGRVLLNLCNNAFYAVNEKYKQNIDGYKPLVVIKTKATSNKATISVKDNGIGIPQKETDKIFQPFFTTKPTGIGVGLGLSMSFDIIKSHGGELKMETKEGEFTEFIIELPLNKSNHKLM